MRWGETEQVRQARTTAPVLRNSFKGTAGLRQIPVAMPLFSHCLIPMR